MTDPARNNDDFDLSGLTPDELAVFMEIVEGNDDLLNDIYTLEYEEVPVDPETFFTDPRYLGTTGVDLYPKILDDLIKVFSTECIEVVLGGAIGWGKSTFTEFGLLRLIYETGCLRSPQRSYGLMEGSSIFVVNLSVTYQQARKAIFSGIRNRVLQSPFFKNEFPYDPTVSTELRFPKNICIFPGASTDNSVLGLNLIGGAVDESNFMPVREMAKMLGGKARGSVVGVYDKADSLYNAILRRMKSRFLRQGSLPGKLFTLSSAQYPNDFIERKTRQAITDKRIFVRNYALWEVKPQGEYSADSFQVEVGTDLQGSRILTGHEPPETLVGDIIDVPVDFFTDFENDIEGSIRDIAGISTLTVDQFIKNFKPVLECVDESIPHPFTGETTTLNDGHKLYRRAYLEPNPLRPKGSPVLRYDPNTPRVAHIDPSILRDATGLAVGHIIDMVKVRRKQPDGRVTEEWAPQIFFDLMLRIIPPKGGEIPFDRVRDIIYELVKDGMPIKVVTADHRSLSAETLQQFQRRGFMTDYVSVDRDMVAYEMLKSSFYEHRITMYNYRPALDELRTLEIDRQKMKVDHPDRGCFVGSTRIPLLDGTCPEISSLVDQEVWVYSVTPDGLIVPGKAKGRLSKQVIELVDVVLDSGAVIRCTPDHLFMLRNGCYAEAQFLRPGIDRLMPVRRHWPVDGGYEHVVDYHGNRISTHRMVYTTLFGNYPGDCILHHINGIKTDNRPENLVVKSRSEHSKGHTIIRHAVDIEYREKVLAGLQRFNLSEDGRRKHADAMVETMRGMTHTDFVRRARNHPSFRDDITLSSLLAIKSDSEATNANAAARMLGCGRNVVIRVLRDSGFLSWDEFIKGNNHKVRHVIPVAVDKPISVYDLGVEKWSNFALSAGVFVHNSKDVADAMAGVCFVLTSYAGNLFKPQVSVRTFG